MTEPYYFEIPIYRCNQDTHTKEMESQLKEYTNEEIKEVAPESYQHWINYFHRSMWYPWKFNEAIGWICLYIFGSQIRGDYFLITSKRIGKGTRNKRFKFYGKAFEHSLPRNLSSSEIYQEITIALNMLKKNRPFKNRYLDLSSFETIGQFVDWVSLVDKLNSFKYPRNYQPDCKKN
jgi:hypothetical protein